MPLHQEQLADGLERFIAAKQHLAATHPLRYLFWEATLRCNLTCRHCGSDCRRDDTTRDRELPAETVMRELDAIAADQDCRDVTFAIIGGEPLIRPDIERVGAHAAALGFVWGITTNAMLLSERRLESLKTAGLATISVSLDGLATAHDTLRRVDGGFAAVCRAIERVLADRFWRAFDVICCVNRLNIDQLAPFVDRLAAMGVPQVRFTPVFSRGRAGRDGGLMLSGPQYAQLLAFVAEARQGRTDIAVTLSEEGYWGPNWECRVRDDLHYCGSGTTIASILHDGTVTGCPSVSRRFGEGNIRDQSFLDLWRHGFSRFRAGRRAQAPHTCRFCEHWDLCEGGGFHLFDPEAPDTPHCGLAKIGERMPPP